jgi:hypothetical protein
MANEICPSGQPPASAKAQAEEAATDACNAETQASSGSLAVRRFRRPAW